jgi:prepilin-type N-terminal cleavage/methylation domain-containing protein
MFAAVRRMRQGFTLSEVVVVLALLATVAAIAIPTYSTVRANTNQQAAERAAQLWVDQALSLAALNSNGGWITAADLDAARVRLDGELPRGLYAVVPDDTDSEGEQLRFIAFHFNGRTAEVACDFVIGVLSRCRVDTGDEPTFIPPPPGGGPGPGGGGNEPIVVTAPRVGVWGDNVDGRLGLPGYNDTVAVSVGLNHACAIIDGGELYCWGSNANGRTGLGISSGATQTPAKVDALAGVVSVATGSNHTCAITEDGALWCWGANASGQLGLDDTVERILPTRVSALDDVDKVVTSLFGSVTCAITGGELYCWGSAIVGRIGLAVTAGDYLTPQLIGGFDGPVVDVALGELHVCATTSDGQVSCAGYNVFGALGLPGLNDAVAVSTGAAHTCVITAAGELWCAGSNANGRTGLGTTLGEERTYLQVPGLENVVSVAAGNNFTCAVSGGEVWCFGANASGRTGLGTVDGNTVEPVKLAGLSGVVSVASGAGAAHACAITATGELWCWGSNANGRTGLGTADGNTTEPARITGIGTVGAVAVGNAHTCAIIDGVPHCWGLDTNGRTGQGVTTTTSTLTPQPVSGLAAAQSITAGDAHSCAINAGALFCWGLNSSSQLGDATTTQRATATAIDATNTYTQISAGAAFTCGVRTNDRVYCWGSNSSGRTGTNSSSGTRTTPTLVSGAINDGTTPPTQLYASSAQACVVWNTDLWCWGAGSFYLRGDNSTGTRTTPGVTLLRTQFGMTPIPGATSTAALAAGSHFTCTIDTAGVLRCWGENTNAQTGLNTTTGTTTEPSVVTLTETVVQVAAGHQHACAILGNGDTRCWGANSSGRTGTGTTSGARTTPTTVTALAGQTTTFGVGYYSSCAVTDDAALWCWGESDNYQTAYNSTTDRTTPTRAWIRNVAEPTLLAGLEPRSIASGDGFSCMVATDGDLWCWGANADGRTGLDTSVGVTLEPTRVEGISDLIEVAAGGRHACALDEAGVIYCWGLNQLGRTGRGISSTSTTLTLTPTAVTMPAEATFVSLSAGEAHTCAVTDTGEVYCWGSRSNGQVGTGVVATSGQTTPALVSGLAAVVEVAAGATHTCALDDTGDVWCWGSDAAGRTGLGISTSTNTLEPTRLETLSGVNDIATGWNHTCATTENELYCWGVNSSGQLGLGDTVSRPLPTEVVSFQTFVTMGAGGAHTCAVNTGGVLFCWGANQYRQLGSGYVLTRMIPAPVTLPGTAERVVLGNTHSIVITQVPLG